MEQLSNQTGTPYVNLHLDSWINHYPGISVDTVAPADVSQIVEVLLADVMMVIERFGAQRVIVENSPYYGTLGKTMRPCIEPGIITRIVEETGCGLLLDISHACIAAHYIGMDKHEYFAHLPTRQLKELHFAGIHQVGDLLQDHQSILDGDCVRWIGFCHIYKWVNGVNPGCWHLNMEASAVSSSDVVIRKLLPSRYHYCTNGWKD